MRLFRTRSRRRLIFRTVACAGLPDLRGFPIFPAMYEDLRPPAGRASWRVRQENGGSFRDYGHADRRKIDVCRHSGRSGLDRKGP